MAGGAGLALLLSACSDSGAGGGDEPADGDATTQPPPSGTTTAPGDDESTGEPDDAPSTTAPDGDDAGGDDDEDGSDEDDEDGSSGDADGVVWEDPAGVSHLFFHSLVIDPETAFADAESGAGYLDFMITQEEFAAILDQLYENDYVLVSPHQLADVEDDGSVTPLELRLPEGKKPLVFSIDDVSYYEYMEGDGFATDLVVEDDGRVRNTYTDADGDTEVGSYDVMGMVDDFVRENPDFSLDGARGVIALTGYDGVLGYRTSPSRHADSNPDLEEDIATATEVADALKEEGWDFGSHTYGHINMTEASLGEVQADTERWRAEVEPIVGETDLLIYPFGADISDTAPYEGEVFEYLKGQGFSFFFNVDGSTTAWMQWGEDYVRQARINIDGLSMAAALDGREVLDAFFDTESVLDPARPDSVSSQ